VKVSDFRFIVSTVYRYLGVKYFSPAPISPAGGRKKAALVGGHVQSVSVIGAHVHRLRNSNISKPFAKETESRYSWQMDWKNIIAEIQRHGQLTQPQIAGKCGCGQATISDLASGKTEQPRHSLGEALLGLLKQVSQEPTSEPTQQGG
jgi:hypothetical protein